MTEMTEIDGENQLETLGDLHSKLLEALSKTDNAAALVAGYKTLSEAEKAAKSAKSGPGSLSRDAIRSEIIDMSAQLGRKPLI